MSTITAVLEPDADGSLHLPVPAELKQSRIRVVATLTAIAESSGNDEAVKRTQAVTALRRIAARGGLRGMGDPTAWQRDIRRDRVLPGRDS